MQKQRQQQQQQKQTQQQQQNHHLQQRLEAPPPEPLTAWRAPRVDEMVGNTPLVELRRIPSLVPGVTVLAKLEGHNPAGSAKDRPALHMISKAEARGDIRPGDTIIEATSGNTGVALAMAAAIKGYKLKLILPAGSSEERKALMAAYGAEVILAPSMEAARDMLAEMEAAGLGHCLDQYNNEDNTDSHFVGTGPEIWRQTGGRVTHLVCTCGTFGTIMGTGGYLKRMNPAIQVIGVQPAPDGDGAPPLLRDPSWRAAAAGLSDDAPGACSGVAAAGGGGGGIPGIRRWPPGYMPGLYKPEGLDRTVDVTPREAEEAARALARVEGVLAGISGGGAASAALRVAAELALEAAASAGGHGSNGSNGSCGENSSHGSNDVGAAGGPVVVFVVADKGERYLSTGVFCASAAASDPAPCPAAELASALPRLLFACPGPHYVMARSPGGGGGPAEAAAAAAARAAVEAGGGRLLEVVATDEADLARMKETFRVLSGGWEPPSTPCLAAWGAAGGPPAAWAGPEQLLGPNGRGGDDVMGSGDDISGAAAEEVAARARAFVRDSWDAAAAAPAAGSSGAVAR